MYLFYIRHLCREEEGIKAAGFELDAEVIIMDRYALRQHRGTATITQNVLGIHVRNDNNTI